MTKRLLRFSELRSAKGIGYARPHIDRMEASGDFPARVQLGQNAVGWFEHELDQWLESRPRGVLPIRATRRNSRERSRAGTAA
jgi:predicted DNA-binding transcriptional regulator AlpA